MKLTLLLPATAALLLSSCVQPAPAYPVAQMSPEDWARSEAYINQVEQSSQEFRHQERISRAQAIELETRNNPTHVTTHRTSFWIW